MKQLKEKKYFYHVVITGAVLIAFVILRAFGVQITFTEPNWDALSSWASWASVAVSGLAIYYAIQIPKKIADRQDKIALFEKRFDCYMIIQDFLTLSSHLESANNASKVMHSYQVIINGKCGIEDRITNETTLADMTRADPILLSGRFLFSEYDINLWEDALDALTKLMVSLCGRLTHLTDGELTDDELKHKNEFCRLCKRFDEEYLDKLEQEMDLKKN